MYCPQCASPIDGVKFCRSCGANVSLVPRALTGQLGGADQEWRPGRHPRSGLPIIVRAASTFFTGVGFLIAAFVIMDDLPGGEAWGWSFLIPAFACIGLGVGQYLQLRELRRHKHMPTAHYSTQPLEPNQPKPQISAPATSELTPPSSITEDTTKQFDASQRRN